MESPSVLYIVTPKDIVEIDDDTLERLYGWVDEIPLTRPKKNVARDFSDGVLAAEVCKFYLPKLVEIHNYVAASAIGKKVSNWQLLNRKVLSKLGLEVSGDMIRAIAGCRQWAIESFLHILRDKIDLYLAAKRGRQQQQQQQHQQQPQHHPNQHRMFGTNNNNHHLPSHPPPVGTRQRFNHYASEPDIHGQWSSRSAISDKTEVDQHSYRNSVPRVYQTPFVAGSMAIYRQQDPGAMMQIFPYISEQNWICYVPLEDFYPSGMVNVLRGTDARKLQAINNQSKPTAAQRRKAGVKVEMVPKVQYEEKEKEVQERQQTIEILQSKIERLEHLLHLKDIRVEDLSNRVELLEAKLQAAGGDPSKNNKGKYANKKLSGLSNNNAMIRR